MNIEKTQSLENKLNTSETSSIREAKNTTTESTFQMLSPYGNISEETSRVLSARPVGLLKTAVLEARNLILVKEETLQVLTHHTPSPAIPIKGLSEESTVAREKVRLFLIAELELSSSEDEIRNFFIEHHNFLKIALGNKIYATPGVNLEPVHVGSHLPKSFLSWLGKEFGVEQGDVVLHRHVQGKSTQDLLHSLGICAPFSTWSRLDYENALEIAGELMWQNPDIKGVISEGSWIYDPKIHENASDGRPYIAAEFLKYDKLTGERFRISKEEWPSKYETQLKFISQNIRRKAMIENNTWSPEVYGAFYPREQLFNYLRELNP